MLQDLHLDIFDLFNPSKHPRDGNGKFAKQWGRNAIATQVEIGVASNMSKESWQYLSEVHRASEARRTARTNALKVNNQATPPSSREIANAKMAVSFADASLYDLIGSMAQSRHDDLKEGPQVIEARALPHGTSQRQVEYVKELTNAMRVVREGLMGRPAKWQEEFGDPGRMDVYAPNAKAGEGARIQQQLQRAYKDIVGLTGFQVEDFSMVYKGDESAVMGSFHDERFNAIELDPRKSLDLEFLHEFAHLAESNFPEIREAEQAWLKERSFDGELYDNLYKSEASYLDSYVDPYAGRVYPKLKKSDDPLDALLADLDDDFDDRPILQQIKEDGAGSTELLSVGLEYFATPFGMAKLYSVDPEHFNFVIEQISIAKRRGDRNRRTDADEFPVVDQDPLVPLFSGILMRLDPGVVTEGWRPEEVKREGQAAVEFLVEDFRRSAAIRTDAIALPVPQVNLVASYFSQVLRQVEPSIDLMEWEPESVIQEGQAALDFLIDEFRRGQAVEVLTVPVVATVPQREVNYLSVYAGARSTTCATCFAYIPGGGCEIVQGAIAAAGSCDLWEPLTPQPLHQDDNQPVQRVIDWHGLKLGIQYLPGDLRHERRLTAAYGHVRGTYGQSDDGMALDVWVNLSGGASARVFKLQQLTQEGEHDEYKYILGVGSVAAAEALYTANMPRKLMGKVEECAIAELRPKRKDAEFEESETVRDGRGRFAKKPSQNPATMPLPVGTEAQRNEHNAPFHSPASLFATSLTQGNSYCRATPQQTKAFIKENRVIAKSSVNLLRTASFVLSKEIEDLQIKSREILDEELKTIDDGIPSMIVDWRITDDDVSAYEVYKKDGIDAAIDHYRKLEEGRRENGYVPDDFLALNLGDDDDIEELIGIDDDDDDDALDLGEDYDYNPGDLDNLFGEQPEWQDDPTMASVREENNRALVQSRMESVAKLEAAIAKSSVTYSLKESGDFAEESIKRISDDKNSNYSKAISRLEDLRAQKEQVADAKGYFNDVYSVIGTIESMPAHRIRTTENSKGEILQVAAVTEGSRYINYLASPAMSAPAKYKKTLIESIEMVKGDESGEIKFATNVVGTALNTPPAKTSFASGVFLEGLITELCLRDSLGDIGCTPLARNTPLFERAGFKADTGVIVGGMTLSAKDAEKFWRMRQAIAQRKDSVTTFLDDAIAWDRELAELEAELGPMMCAASGQDARSDAEFNEGGISRDGKGRFAKKAAAKIEFFDPENLKDAKTEVSYLRGWNQPAIINIKGSQYVIKKSRGAVPEAVGSAIARAGNVPHIEVSLVRGQVDSLGKRRLISKKVDGVQDVKTLDTIAQQIGPIHTHWSASGKYSATKPTALASFANMLKHPDLAKIAALDIFTSNTDRTTSNLMYDMESGGYLGVDMEYAYDSQLRPAASYTPGSDEPADGGSYVYRNENIANLLEGSSNEELDRHFDGTEIDTLTSTLDSLHQKLDVKGVSTLFREALDNGNANMQSIDRSIEQVHAASSRSLARLKEYQSWKGQQRSDAEFDESKIKRANDGKFGQKNRLTTYSPDVHRVIKSGEDFAKKLISKEEWAVIDASRSKSQDLLRTERGMRLRIKSGEKVDGSALAYLQNQVNAGLADLCRSPELLSAINSLKSNLSSAYGLKEEEARAIIDSKVEDGGTLYGTHVNGAPRQHHAIYLDAAKDAHVNLLTQTGIDVKVTSVDVDAGSGRSGMHPSRSGNMAIIINAEQYEEYDWRKQTDIKPSFRRDIYHEAGHSLEFGDKELQDACQHFLMDRNLPPNGAIKKVPYGTQSDYQKRKNVELDAMQLKSVFPGDGYDDDEYYAPGQFIHPYVGKIYAMGEHIPNARATEVISVGLEHFTSNHSMHDLLAIDPDHFFLTLGAIARNRRIKTRRDAGESDRADAEFDESQRARDNRDRFARRSAPAAGATGEIQKPVAAPARTDSLFNWKESDRVRDGNGRFAKKPGYLTPSKQALPNIPKEVITEAAARYREKNAAGELRRGQGIIVPAVELIGEYVRSPHRLSSEENAILMNGRDEKEVMERMSQGQRDKIGRIMASGNGITLPEAIGLRSYLEGLRSFRDMNSALRSDLEVIERENGEIIAFEKGDTMGGMYQFKEDGTLVEPESEGPGQPNKSVSWLVRGRAATQALAKLPPPTIENLVEISKTSTNASAMKLDRQYLRDWGYHQKDGQYERMDESFKKYGMNYKDGRLGRVINVNPNDFDRFRAANPEGAIVTDPGFYSTYIPVNIGPTLAQMEYTRNVSYEIDWNPNNSAARFVDHMKEGTQENEMLFPPGSRFRVTQPVADNPHLLNRLIVRIEEVRP